MPGTLAWQRPGLDDACQSGEMAPLLNSLFLVFEISLLPSYCANSNVMIILNWCSGIACNWCVSLTIALILALTTRLNDNNRALNPSFVT